MIRQFELVERVKAYDPAADEDALNRAYVFAMKAHGSQSRASGDPYFSHPLGVAELLARMKLDSASIVTGLLHDTVEDTDATLEQIEQLFGKEIARLVDGVTKLSRIELQSDHTKHAENFRKLVLAMSADIRVLLVKLADRLHNMQTLNFIKDVGQAPAHRAGDAGDLCPARRAHGHAADEGRAREPLLRRALSRCQGEHRPAPEISARAGRRDRAAHHRRAEAHLGRRRHRGLDLGPREDALFDLAQDAAQEHQLRAALRHHGLPHRGARM